MDQGIAAATHERATLELVAARAGVSRATASRVLRGAENVSATARESVLRAADELAYQVNRAARSLVTRRTDSIGFLVAENEERMFHDPYFLGILRGAQSAVAAAGMQLVFAIASSADEAATFEHFVTGGHVDGVLLVSLHGDTGLPERLEARGVPTVLNGRPYGQDGSLYIVDSDNLAGARAATDLLLARGARCVASITGPLDMGVGQDRLTGFRQALANAGRPDDPDLVVEGDFTVESGADAMGRLLDRHEDLDAVFVASDLMAIGALRTLRRRGCRVPDDVAVVGFDDIREAGNADPALTTVAQPVGELGRTMAETLLDRLNGGDATRHTVLPVEIVRRASA